MFVHVIVCWYDTWFKSYLCSRSRHHQGLLPFHFIQPSMDELYDDVDPFDLSDQEPDSSECDAESDTSHVTETMTEPADPVFRFVCKSYCEDVVSNFRQQRLERQFLDVTLKVGCLIYILHIYVLHNYSCSLVSQP